MRASYYRKLELIDKFPRASMIVNGIFRKKLLHTFLCEYLSHIAYKADLTCLDHGNLPEDYLCVNCQFSTGLFYYNVYVILRIVQKAGHGCYSALTTEKYRISAVTSFWYIWYKLVWYSICLLQLLNIFSIKIVFYFIRRKGYIMIFVISFYTLKTAKCII